MIHHLGDYQLRKPEPSDVDALYEYKNDPTIASMLGGFAAKGYSRIDIANWIDFHNKKPDEVLWSIVHTESARCVGHVGLYEIDHRVRAAEFALLIGDRSAWGQGLGSACTRFAINFAFKQLNLNRIHLSVLESNERAAKVYERCGFLAEGRLRQAQYKDGRYLDIIIMSLLRDEYDANGS
jgi:[ribosomal protein S5]-alanine N-acetyltransferase